MSCVEFGYLLCICCIIGIPGFGAFGGAFSSFDFLGFFLGLVFVRFNGVFADGCDVIWYF